MVGARSSIDLIRNTRRLNGIIAKAAIQCVGAIATIEVILARAAIECVIATNSVEIVAAIATIQNVVLSRPDNVVVIPEFSSRDSWMAGQAVILSPSGSLIREDWDERCDQVAGGFRCGGVAAAGLRHKKRQSIAASVGAGCGLRWHDARGCGADRRHPAPDAADRQLLVDAHGPDGLIDAKLPGRKPKLSVELENDLCHLVEAGPDIDTDGVVRWRCIDLKRVLSDRSGVDVSRVTLGRVLKKLGFSHISARPRHPGQKPEAIAAFKKTSPSWPPRP